MKRLTELNHNKIGIVFAFTAFIIAWVAGLSASVPPDAILWRSAVGAVVFFLLGGIAWRILQIFLDAPPAQNNSLETED